MTAFKFYIALAVLGFVVYYIRRWSLKEENKIKFIKITKEKLKIYTKYSGDADLFARVGQDYEKEIIDDTDWGTISGYLHSLELIRKGLTSAEFKDRTIRELKKVCDKQSFEDLTK